MRGEPEGVRDIWSDETLMDYYLDHRSVEPATERDYQQSWRKLQDALGELGYEIDNIQRSHVEEILELWENHDLSESKIDNHINNLNRMADWCVTQASVADYNPFRAYTSKYKSDTRKRQKR